MPEHCGAIMTINFIEHRMRMLANVKIKTRGVIKKRNRVQSKSDKKAADYKHSGLEKTRHEEQGKSPMPIALWSIPLAK